MSTNQKSSVNGPKLGFATHPESGVTLVNLDYKERKILGIMVPCSDFHTLQRNIDRSKKRIEGPFVVVKENDSPNPQVKEMVDELAAKGAMFIASSDEKRIVFKSVYKVPVYRHFQSGGIDFLAE